MTDEFHVAPATRSSVELHSSTAAAPKATNGKVLELPARRYSGPWQPRKSFHSTKSGSVSDVTFAITAFERPHHLRKLVESIRKYYPHAQIIVGDNGNQKASLPSDVKVFDLPFDCGLSATRNFLIDQTPTEFFLLLEDDFEFTDETHVELLADVLDYDAEVGVVGGTLYCGKIKQHYAVDIHRFRHTLSLEPSRGSFRATPNGVVYQICDMCFNFALFRRSMLTEHRWHGHLKVGEHCPFFEAVKAAALARSKLRYG